MRNWDGDAAADDCECIRAHSGTAASALAIAIRPMLELVSLGSAFLGMLPSEWSSLPFDWLPQGSVLLLGGGLFAIGMMTFRMLEE